MTTTRMHTKALTALLVTGALALSACGGGDDDSTTTIGNEGGVVTTSPTAGADLSPDDATTEGGAAAVPAPFRDDDAELDVEDQSGDGTTVVVEEVRLSRTAGWLAVFAEDGETLLGHAPVEPSDDERRLDVTLDQPVTGTQTLLAVLFADDGDGAFDPAADPRVTDDDDDHDDDDFKTDRFTYRAQ
ncbi:MAG TPA: hypothetical protein VK894_11625 [Jiangellales bacterium]|nr:hypothetical protein [Jiangellales bacterium]